MQGLNFLERDLVRSVLRATEVDRLFVLQIKVKAPKFLDGTGADDLCLCFGVAACHGSELRLFRVRDHLRGMGLGRRALRKLVETHRIESYGTREALLEALVQEYRGEFSTSAWYHFVDLFKSVERQQAEEQAAPAAE